MHFLFIGPGREADFPRRKSMPSQGPSSAPPARLSCFRPHLPGAIMELKYLKLARRLAERAKHNCKPRLPGFCLSAKQFQADPLNKPSAKQIHWLGIYHGNMLRATQAHGKPPPCPQDASGGAQAA